MGENLSYAQIEKYAARLMGQRLLPVLKEWQLKRAIKRLAIDGRKPSLDALKQSVIQGLLGQSRYSSLLELVLRNDVDLQAANRVRSHLKSQDRDKPQTFPRYSSKPSPKPPPADWKSGAGISPQSKAPNAGEAQKKPILPNETFKNTSDPIRLLREYLNVNTETSVYRVDLRERVRSDSSRRLLQEICELWDKEGGNHRQTLCELIEFIELVPERPLWLRRNVALDCGMPWQLADDSPSIAQHLVTTTQLRTRKEAVLRAIRRIRREDTKAEICDLWFEHYRREGQDQDFDNVLLQVGFLPKQPLEQRVAIALTCGWAERLAFDDKEVLAYLLPFLEHPKLGSEARRAIDNIKNPSTLKALRDQYDQEAGQSEQDEDQSPTNKVDEISSVKEDLAHQASAQQPLEYVNTLNDLASGTDDAVAIELQDNSDEAESLEDESTRLIDSETNQSTASGIDTQGSLLADEEGAGDPSEFDSEAGDEAEAPSADTSISLRSSISRPQGTKSYLEFKSALQEEDDWEDLSLAEASWKDEDYLDTMWISKLDRFANLAPDQRRKIISEIAKESFDNDDWISDLLADDFDNLARPIELQRTGGRIEDKVAQPAKNESSESGDRAQDSNESVGSNMSELTRRLLGAGLQIEHKGMHVLVIRASNGESSEIDRIDLDDLERMSISNLEAYLDSCIESARVDRSYGEIKDRDIAATDFSSGAFIGDEVIAVDALLLNELSSAKLDSASIFLIECASDLLSPNNSNVLSPYASLIAGLLTFHTREWNAEILAYEEHMEMNEDALRNDSECLSGALLQEIVPYKDNVFAARYRFDPQQPFRLTPRRDKKNPRLICQSNHVLVELESVDLIHGFATVLVKAANKDYLNEKVNFVHVPQDFSQSLRQNLAQQAPGWIKGHSPLPKAFTNLLQRIGSDEIRDLNVKADAHPENRSQLISEFLCKSEGISLVVQGPPGSGKTTCAAEIICCVALSGLKVGISANSHLAIDTLLEKVSSIVRINKDSLRLAKYQSGASRELRDAFQEKGIRVIDNSSFNMLYDVYAGTSHAFSKATFEDLFDLLVVDEASQVSLASLLAMARCTRNILLVGDQQQLPQPLMANHPGESGLSSLDYATSDQRTVAGNIGIFLSKSWRMHPRVCSYISATFYDQRLRSYEANSLNMIPSTTTKNGVLYLPVDHRDNHVFSIEEAEAIKVICQSLLGQECELNVNGEARKRLIRWDDLAIMAPYNAQVSLIQRVLGPDARVGTVDRYQGQEAPISIYSITTSREDNSGILEFVLNKNRVNVALSRSQCLSIVVGSPSLTTILNSSPELEEQRKLFFSLTPFIGSSLSLSPQVNTVSSSSQVTDSESGSTFVLGSLLNGSEAPVALPDRLKDLRSIKLARKLFRFPLSSTEILDLYRYRLFDELTLILDFCGWDLSEKEWQRTKLLIRLASSTIAPPMLLDRLAKRGESKIRQAVAANPNTPIDLVKELWNRESSITREGVPMNPGLPEEMYFELYNRKGGFAHRGLASNPSTPESILHELVNSDEELISRLAKANLTERDSRSQKCSSSVPASGVGTSFSLDSDDPLELAKNPSVPASLLSKLVNSPSQKVRSALAANPSLGVDDVQAMAFDSNDSVRCELANRTDLPAQVMRALAADRSRFVRRNLADNPSCNDEAFKRLVSDSDVYVRERVAKHPSLSYRACSWILADTEARVQLALADNPNAPASAFVSARDEYYLESLLGEKPSALKALLLLSPNLPKSKLDGVKITPDPAIRLAIALCPHSSASILHGLKDDEEPEIRKTAASRLAVS